MPSLTKLLKRAFYVFTFGDEIDDALEKARLEKEQEKLLREKDYLQLCERHKQELYGSHYSPCNCDYCKALSLIPKENRSALRVKD